QFDPLGDAVLLLDGTGAVTAHQLHDAWGNPLMTATGPHGYRARYGYYTDQETGLVALAYRYYAPGVGRFLNRDPVGFVDGPLLYQYCRGNVAGSVDPVGLQAARFEYPIGIIEDEYWGLIGSIGVPPIYGWYCGPQSGGQTGTGPSADSLDACCQAHDACFRTAGCNILNQCFSRDCRTCTAELCQCFGSTSCSDAADVSACLLARAVFRVAYCNSVFR
ncbi:MAG: hypothetical protein HUU35_11630, partial [Armatimonadetes bacterium]|nr:hypothetical protein [Armatimonadota bacterium]